ncbi:hypothetical protein HK096_004064, partial [Nowakowskiella sp. JEL0078]
MSNDFDLVNCGSVDVRHEQNRINYRHSIDSANKSIYLHENENFEILNPLSFQDSNRRSSKMSFGKAFRDKQTDFQAANSRIHPRTPLERKKFERVFRLRNKDSNNFSPSSNEGQFCRSVTSNIQDIDANSPDPFHRYSRRILGASMKTPSRTPKRIDTLEQQSSPWPWSNRSKPVLECLGPKSSQQSLTTSGVVKSGILKMKRKMTMGWSKKYMILCNVCSLDDIQLIHSQLFEIQPTLHQTNFEDSILTEIFGKIALAGLFRTPIVIVMNGIHKIDKETFLFPLSDIVKILDEHDLKSACAFSIHLRNWVELKFAAESSIEYQSWISDLRSCISPIFDRPRNLNTTQLKTSDIAIPSSSIPVQDEDCEHTFIPKHMRNENISASSFVNIDNQIERPGAPEPPSSEKAFNEELMEIESSNSTTATSLSNLPADSYYGVSVISPPDLNYSEAKIFPSPNSQYRSSISSMSANINGSDTPTPNTIAKKKFGKFGCPPSTSVYPDHLNPAIPNSPTVTRAKLPWENGILTNENPNRFFEKPSFLPQEITDYHPTDILSVTSTKKFPTRSTTAPPPSPVSVTSTATREKELFDDSDYHSSDEDTDKMQSIIKNSEQEVQKLIYQDQKAESDISDICSDEADSILESLEASDDLTTNTCDLESLEHIERLLKHGRRSCSDLSFLSTSDDSVDSEMEEEIKIDISAMDEPQIRSSYQLDPTSSNVSDVSTHSDSSSKTALSSQTFQHNLPILSVWEGAQSLSQTRRERHVYFKETAKEPEKVREGSFDSLCSFASSISQNALTIDWNRGSVISLESQPGSQST